MGNFVDELTAAACEGMKKRSRLNEFERDSVEPRLEREWKRIKPDVIHEAEAHGCMVFRMHYDASRNQEFHPDEKYILERVPEDLQDLRTAEGCYVRVNPGEEPRTWEIEINISQRVYTLKDKMPKDREKEKDEAVKRTSTVPPP